MADNLPVPEPKRKSDVGSFMLNKTHHDFKLICKNLLNLMILVLLRYDSENNR